ncbi:synaptotagmin-like protein 5 isoform X2 [Labrus mixtus]|uniref:synaptotagmin-like protein 5 isoform X2 n=1 Tax=Labrus mixtus TaxID=508554 RepID=UPI0029C013F1|nr:synaptotagmin-like protein 5 isoform X2 [Labrus mixtus]
MEEIGEDLNLSFLLEHEREMILKVLQKDEKLRKREEKRIRKLKNELLEIKRKGSCRPHELGERQCARCLKNLGLIFDRGDLCDECQMRVCSECRVKAPTSRNWKCNVCAKISELKVVTGEWFLEERSKRFEQEVACSDVIKHTIISSPIIFSKKSTENLSAASESDRADTPKSKRTGVLRKGRKMDKKGARSTLKPENGVDSPSSKSLSDGDAQSLLSVRSSTTLHTNRGGALALESSGLPTVPNNLRSQPADRSQTSNDNRRPDGAESVTSLHSSDSTPEKKAPAYYRKSPGAPTISVSKASVSSDLSHSEMDLSVPGSEPSDDALNRRRHSIPGLTETDFTDEETEEDIDALMSAHGKSAKQRPSIDMSMSSTPGSVRRWGHLNVPDSDAETSSINSMLSMYSESGDYGNARVSGEILLKISYSYKTGALNVLVRECHNLATGDEKRQRTDAYVKTYLLPDMSRQSKRKTSVKANSISPVFNENLRYVISHSQLETRTLQVSVWHHDRFGQNNFLGEVELTFDSWEFDTQIEEWYALQPKVESSVDSTMPYKGELTVVLKYIPGEKNLMPLDEVPVKKGFLKSKKAASFTLPEGGMVELLVKGAKNLTAVKSGGTSDPFVKGYLLPDNNKSTKHKTAVERRTVNPVWNHTFTYCGLQPGDLNNVCLELTVWDKEALASNVFLGGVRLGAGSGKSYGNEVDWMDSFGEEQRLWQRMMENPQAPQECTLMLRSSMGKCHT